MAKKVNVSSLLNSAMNDDFNPAETVKGLKAQRNEKTVPVTDQTNSKRNYYSGELQNSSLPEHNNTKLSTEHPHILALEELLEQQNFSDRKEQFIFRLSQECFEDYEELTRAINYKLNKKLSRNDIMRKVLEDYHNNKLQELLIMLHSI